MLVKPFLYSVNLFLCYNSFTSTKLSNKLWAFSLIRTSYRLNKRGKLNYQRNIISWDHNTKTCGRSIKKIDFFIHSLRRRSSSVKSKSGDGIHQIIEFLIGELQIRVLQSTTLHILKQCRTWNLIKINNEDLIFTERAIFKNCLYSIAIFKNCSWIYGKEKSYFRHCAFEKFKYAINNKADFVLDLVNRKLQDLKISVMHSIF